MKKVLTAAAIAVALTAGSAQAQDNELRIGYMTTLTTNGALVGQEMKRGWDLGLQHQGWNEDGDELGGVPTRVFVGDDALRPDTGLQIVNRWLRQDNVHIVAGFIWSHVLMASAPRVYDARRILLVTNAGAAPLQGRRCNPLYITTSWNNDQNAEATGQLANDDDISSVYILAPNYQAGRDNLDGFRRTFGGDIAGQALFPIGASDYQAEIARIREAQPEAVFIFAPGSMGIAFLRQWAASGLNQSIRLYTVWTVDNLTLPVHGDAAVGTFHTNYWNHDLDNDANRRFVEGFIAEHGRPPSHFAAQAYDAPALIASGVRAVNGNVEDIAGMMRAMRQGQIESVRSGGPIEYNVNGVPIQNWYRRTVLMGDEGPVIRTLGVVFADRSDSYAGQCPQRAHVR